MQDYFVLYNEKLEELTLPRDRYGYGVFALDMLPESIEREYISESTESIPGKNPMGYTDRSRSIEAKLYIKARDTRDYRLIRSELYAFLYRLGYFYIADIYERNKLYKVNLSSSFIPERPERMQRFANATLSLETCEQPYARSRGTTKNLDENGINVDSALWGFGMGLTSEAGATKYTHTVSQNQTFKIWDGSDMEFEVPFFNEFKMTIDQMSSETGFKLINQTNNTQVDYKGAVFSSHTVVYNGPRIERNSLNAMSDEQGQPEWLTTTPGWNTIKLERAGTARVSIDMPFHYY